MPREINGLIPHFPTPLPDSNLKSGAGTGSSAPDAEHKEYRGLSDRSEICAFEDWWKCIEAVSRKRTQ
jgi:hypothetical protein